MPICFKCGKDLASDQSLQYHLNKRVPCTSLYCKKCKKQFPNKIVFDTHFHTCKPVEEIKKIDTERHKIYDRIKSDKVFLIEINENQEITYFSQMGILNIMKQSKLCDLLSEDSIMDMKDAINYSLKEVPLKFLDINCKTMLTKYDNLWLLTNTIVT